MKKRGAPIKHKAASMPGVLALAVCPEYETRLRMAVNALSDGWMEEGQFNDLADTIDMLQIGMASYSRQKPDPSTAVAIDVCREAMMSIRERYIKTGKFGATGEELKATRLLADVSLDFWRRRSGVLFAFSVQQLKELRADQRDKAKQHKEETEAMNTRDNAPKLPAIDGAINAVHSLLMKSGDALSADGVAKALTIKKTEASKQLRDLNGLGLLESEPRKGGTMFFRLAAVAPVSNINEMGDVSLANEGKTAEVCESVKTGGESQASAVIGNSEGGETDAPEAVGSIPKFGHGLSCGACHDGCPGDQCKVERDSPPISDAQRAEIGAMNAAVAWPGQDVGAAVRIAELEATVALQRETLAVAAEDVSRLSEELAAARAENIALKTLNDAMPGFGAEHQEQKINSLTTDVTNTRRALSDALNEADRMRSELAIERQARQALQEQIDAAPILSPMGFVLKVPKRPMRSFGKEKTAKSAAMAAARASGRGEVFALIPVGVARKGAEWRNA